MRGRAVRAPAQLAEVREPRVGPLDRPPRSDDRFDRRALQSPLVVPSLSYADHVVEGDFTTGGFHTLAVVPAIEVEGFDVCEQAAFIGGSQRRGD